MKPEFSVAGVRIDIETAIAVPIMKLATTPKFTFSIVLPT